MASANWSAIATGGTAGKIASPVESENSATGQASNNDSTVANGEVISQLQDQVTELQKRIRIQDEQLQKADELNQEMLELRPKHWLTTEELRIKNEQLQQAETEIQRLKLENLELHKQVGNSIQPDIDSIRDRTLNKLKMGRQSISGKAIDAFIKEIQRE